MRRKDREVSDRVGIEEILEQCKTTHLAMTDGDMPYVVPLSYGYAFTEDGKLEIYLHSALEGKKLDILKRNNKVCFEMSCEGEPVSTENPCNTGYCYSSVIGFGQAVFIQDTTEKCAALSVMFKRQTGKSIAFNSRQAEQVCVFKIISADYTGKKKPRPSA